MDDSQYVKPRSKLVMLTGVLPSVPADNAGARFVNWVVDALSERNEVLLLVPDGPAAHRARATGNVPPHLLLGECHARFASIVHRISIILLPFVMPVHVPWRFTRELLRNPAVRAEIRSADVIDLQWQEQGTLIPLLRALNPTARIVCTFHDVLSQRFDRSRGAATSLPRRMRWAWAAAQARHTERQILRRADAVVVLSEKDRRLLPSSTGNVHVVTPPLAIPAGTVEKPVPEKAELLFVSFLARWENEEGLLWFLADVWPKVKNSFPDARFRIAGDGIRPTIQQASDLPGVELLGFVPDLEPLYEQASVVIVPIRLGAGVKFKVVDALVAGVPVVTTSVGAEGIGEPFWFAGIHDNADDFSQAVIDVLANPAVATARSQRVREEALDKYGAAQFEETMERIYSHPGTTPDSSVLRSKVVLSYGNEQPDASVVLPVHNGAQTIENQLRALADQAADLALEVVVADNGSTDETRAVAARWKDKFSALKIVDAGGIRGAAYARNEGVRHASSEKILFCDADDVVRPGWAKSLASALDGHSYVGSAFQKVTSGVAGVSASSSAVKQETPMSVHGFLSYALSCSCAVRRDAFMSIGGFDTSYKAGHEEVDFGWRMQLAGHELRWLPDTVIDYIQRTNVKSTYKQNFHYAKSAILLWTRFNQDYQLRPVSFKGSIRNLAGQLSRIGLLLSSEKQMSYAKALGWTAGTVAGHLEYRLIGRTLERQLMEFTK